MDWSVITGISSVIIALCALVFTIWQSNQTQRHNRLSFKPHLSSISHVDGQKGFYFTEIINNGLGPAIIESYAIKLDGNIMPGDGTEKMTKALKLLFPSNEFKTQQSYMSKDYSMAAKETSTIVSMQFTGEAFPSPKAVEHAFKRIDITIKYKSFYEEEYTYSTEEDKFQGINSGLLT